MLHSTQRAQMEGSRCCSRTKTCTQTVYRCKGTHQERRRCSMAASRLSGNPPASAACQPQSKVEEATGIQTAKETHLKRHEAALLAAAGLSSWLLLSTPQPVLAEQQEPLPTQDAQAFSSILLPAGSMVANLAAPEAPALVSNSGEVLLEGVKGIVGNGLQDLTENSMTAVGGPVTGEVLSASASSNAASVANDNSNQSSSPTAPDTTQNIQHQQQQAPYAAAAIPAGSNNAHVQQQQQQQHMPGMWCAVWRAYCDALERSPLPTKIYTGVVGTLLGDLAAQVMAYTSLQRNQPHTCSCGSSINPPAGATAQQQQQGRAAAAAACPGFQFDALRTARLCLYSAAIGTPMGHYWYGLLESAVMPATPLAPAAVAAKVALDQLLQTPFGMALFFTVMKVLEGKPQDVKEELQSKMMPALLANWKLWPAAQLINFTLIPEEQRILYGNIVGICWTCVISNLQQQATGSINATTGTISSSSSSNVGVASTGVDVVSAPAVQAAEDSQSGRGDGLVATAASRAASGFPAVSGVFGGLALRRRRSSSAAA